MGLSSTKKKVLTSQILEHNNLLGLGNPRDRSIAVDKNSIREITFVYRIKAPTALTNEERFQSFVGPDHSVEHDTDTDPIGETSGLASPPNPQSPQDTACLIPVKAEQPEDLNDSRVEQEHCVKDEQSEDLNDSTVEQEHCDDVGMKESDNESSKDKVSISDLGGDDNGKSAKLQEESKSYLGEADECNRSDEAGSGNKSDDESMENDENIDSSRVNSLSADCDDESQGGENSDCDSAETGNGDSKDIAEDIEQQNIQSKWDIFQNLDLKAEKIKIQQKPKTENSKKFGEADKVNKINEELVGNDENIDSCRVNSLSADCDDESQEGENNDSDSGKADNGDVEAEMLKLHNHTEKTKIDPPNFCGGIKLKIKVPPKIKQAKNPEDKISTGKSKKKEKKIKEKSVRNAFLDREIYAKKPVKDTFSWSENKHKRDGLPVLALNDFKAAPVSDFHHVPLAESDEESVVGMKVEVDLDRGKAMETIWTSATILQIEGYMALLGIKEGEKYWFNLMSHHIRHISNSIQAKDEFAKANMLQPKDSLTKEEQFKVGDRVEVIDRANLGQMKVARVEEIIGGRLHLKYEQPDELDQEWPGEQYTEFWTHKDSSLVHEVGWSKAVGHMIEASQEYLKETKDQSKKIKESLKETQGFEKGMKLEVVDPFIPGNISVATIMEVLLGGFIYVRIDASKKSYETPENSWFCYSTRSQHIFYKGFCEQYDITLDIPDNHKGKFEWSTYLKKFGLSCKPVPRQILERLRVVKGMHNGMHKFQKDMKVECADLIEPNLICPATIQQVKGRLLKVHFDGYEDEQYDQWMDCRSLDLYPVGWCDLVGQLMQKPLGWEEEEKREKRKKEDPEEFKKYGKKKKRN